MSKLIVMLILLFVVSCSSNSDTIDRFESNNVVNRFGKSSILNRNDYYFYSLYYADSTLEYSFKNNDGNIELVFDTVNYIENIGDSYKREILFNEAMVKDSFNGYLYLMEELGIDEYSTEYRFTGVDLKINMIDGSHFYYVNDMDNVTLESWAVFFSKLESPKENWYFEE